MSETEELRQLCRDLWVLHMETCGLVPTRCKQCGAVIVPTRINMVFCSKVCCVNHHRGTKSANPRPAEKQDNGSEFYHGLVDRMQRLGVKVMRDGFMEDER